MDTKENNLSATSVRRSSAYQIANTQKKEQKLSMSLSARNNEQLYLDGYSFTTFISRHKLRLFICFTNLHPQLIISHSASILLHRVEILNEESGKYLHKTRATAVKLQTGQILRSLHQGSCVQAKINFITKTQ